VCRPLLPLLVGFFSFAYVTSHDVEYLDRDAIVFLLMSLCNLD
jgi:hypothetical protein